MNINKFTTSLACVALVLSSSWDGNYYGVDAWASFNDVVTCLADAPTICVGTSIEQGPSLAYDEATNTTTDIGGWKFTYDFMDGLETYNGTEFGKITDDDVLAEANATTLEVSVTIDDDGSCVIDVGSDTCSSCSTNLCGFDDIANGDTDLPLSVTFDCTNVVNGRASLPEVCESLPYLWYEGVFYPLMYTALSMMDKEETDTNVEGLTVADNVDTPDAATCGTMAEGVLPQDGQECQDVMPEGKSMIGCAGESISGTTKTAASCECEPSKATTWTCTTSESQIKQKACPAQDDPKASGDSCEGLLSEANAQQRCMWTRATSMDTAVEEFWCTCANTGDSANTWVCDGTFAPAAAPTSTMMDATTPQEIVTTPVDTPPAAGNGTMSECPDTVVENGSSCDGFLQGSLSEASCAFSQTSQANNDAPVTETATCTCAATDLLWSCEGPLSVSKENYDASDIANVDVAEAKEKVSADVADAKEEVSADVAEKKEEISADVEEKKDEVTADVAAVNDESAASMNFATMACVIAVVATTTTMW